jgi:hypothetical protein
MTSWLSRDQIAKDNDIGAGTRSAIIKEAMQEDPEFDLQRQVAVILKNNLDIKSFASLIRIRNKLIIKMRVNDEENRKVDVQEKREEETNPTTEKLKKNLKMTGTI